MNMYTFVQFTQLGGLWTPESAGVDIERLQRLEEAMQLKDAAIGDLYRIINSLRTEIEGLKSAWSQNHSTTGAAEPSTTSAFSKVLLYRYIIMLNYNFTRSSPN